MKTVLLSLSLTCIGTFALKAQYSIVDYKSCESLSGISTFVDQVSPSNPMAWEVLNGYSSNGFGVIGSCYGAHIEYLQSFTGNSYLEFYCKAFQMGYQNRIPTVTINGTALTTILLNTNTTGSYIKLRTSAISAGSHVVRIEYGHTGMYYQYFIDEINTFSDANSAIAEFSEEPFLLYPSITSETLQIAIQSEEATPFTIHNQFGQIVFVGTIESSESIVRVDAFEPGVYFVTIGTLGSTKRFIKL